MPTDISDLSNPALSYGPVASTVVLYLGVPRKLMTQNWIKLEGPHIFYRSIRVFSYQVTLPQDVLITDYSLCPPYLTLAILKNRA